MMLNRNFYSFAVFTSGLSGAIYFIQALIYLLIGQQIFTLHVFFPWYLFYNAVLILGALIYVHYFRFKKYALPFWAMLLNVIAGVIPFTVFTGAYLGRRDWLPLYLPAEMVALATSIVLGVVLIISAARERYWLKIAGIFFVVSGIAVMAPAIWYINSTSADKASMLEQIVKWASLLSCIGPMLVMTNFLDEQKQMPPENENAVLPRNGETVMNAVKVIAMLATIIFVLTLTSETVAKISWDRKLALKTQQWEKVWGARTFTDTRGDTLRYQLIYPENMDSTKKYPMVVCLPYGGGIEGSPAAQFLLTEANRKKHPAFLFVPFCPNGAGWGGIPNYPTIDTVVFASIEAVEDEFHEIDVSRVYVTGVSRGGYGSWHFISLRPGLFAAAMPVCGGGDPTLAANMVDVAVWAFHGEDDRNVPVSGSRDIIAAIKKSGGNPRYTEFPDSGHDIWHFVTTTPGVFEWLFEQKKELGSVSSASEPE